MGKRFLYLLKLAAFWFAYFIVWKVLFLVYNLRLTLNLPMHERFLVFAYGAKMDISVSCYVLLIPIILFVLTSLFRAGWVKPVLRIYTLVLLIVFTVIAIGDLELYRFWGYRIDTTPLLYLQQPKEAFASVSAWVIIRQLLVGAIWVLIFYQLYRHWVEKNFAPSQKTVWYAPPAFLLFGGLLVIPIRGGFDLAPLNVGTAYFSEHAFANHAAINGLFNLGYALTNTEVTDNPYKFFKDPEMVKKTVKNLYQDNGIKREILKNKRPNVLVILLESFSAKIVETLGGTPGVAPNISRLSKEGILFTNFYASGNRSDKGIVAVLSGFPAQPIASIIKFPGRAQQLPMLCHDLKKEGYHTAYFYGGDINFANMNSYVTMAGFDKIISKDHFPPSTYGAKWGVHDQVTFDTLYQHLQKEQPPFFYMMFTLSSHEPYDVPGKTAIPGDDEYHKYLNSVHYTDQALGDFIERCKKTDWWKNTLVLLVADHGTMHPQPSTVYDPNNFHIPLILLGGALNTKGIEISKYGSQTDIYETLLQQMGLQQPRLEYSKDLLSEGSHSFAWYAYNNGFGMATDSVTLTFDCNSYKPHVWKGNNSKSLIKDGKAYLQQVYQEVVLAK